MFDKKISRLRRSKRTRAKINEMKAMRLCVYRSNQHIYAQIIALGASGTEVMVSASTVESALGKEKPNGATVSAAASVGKRVAERAVSKGITSVAFDRSGFRYHGRIKALAEAAREGGLQF